MNMYSKLWKLSFLALIMGLLAACGGNESDNRVLPTLITVPASQEQDTDSTSEELAARGTLPPSWTPGPSPTPSDTPQVTPSFTITSTPSRTPTLTPIPSETPTPTVEVGALDTFLDLAIQQLTEQPSEFHGPQPGPTIPGFGSMSGLITLTVGAPDTDGPTPIASGCTYYPPGGFGLVFSDPAVAQAIGCPLGSPPTTINFSSASQTFERGAMLWLSESPGYIFILFNDGTFRRVVDTFDPNTDPVSGGETPPTGLFEPVRGFGKVWRMEPGVRDRLGWATGQELGGSSVVLDFVRGRMISANTRGDILVLITTGALDSGTWSARAGQF
jgi:hypothetical protein